ncbi:ABC transporter substrate-binding protein [Thermocatellispora tengchongensis]
MPGLDPVLLTTPATGMERGLPVFDSLLRLDASGEVKPQLAESMTSGDAKVWTMKLRPGVRFTDGTPLDAEAVAYNVERHRAPGSLSPGKALLSSVEEVEVVDDLTIRFTLAHPSGSFPNVFTAESSVGFIGSPAAIKADPEGFRDKPVGAGPFMFKEWVKDDHLTLVKNPQYWQRGLPHLDGIEFKIIPDGQTRADALRSDAVQLTQADPDNYRPLAADGRFVVHEGSGGQFVFLNQSTEAGRDVRLRRAIQLAFDPKTANSVIFGANSPWDGDVDCLPWTKESPACLKGDAPAQDIAEAKRLVAEYVADGGKPRLTLTINDTKVKDAEYIQATLRQIGIDVTIRGLPAAEMATAQAKGDFEFGWSAVSAFASFYPRGYNYFAAKGRNLLKQSNAALDAALDQGRDALTADERNKGWRKVQSILNEQAMAVWYSPYPTRMISSSRLRFAEDYRGGSVYYTENMSLR